MDLDTVVQNVCYIPNPFSLKSNSIIEIAIEQKAASQCLTVKKNQLLKSFLKLNY